MKIVRYRFGDKLDYGIVDGENICELQGDVFGDFRKGPEVTTLKETALLAPCQPSKIIAIGLNYSDHAREVGMAIPKEPLLFLKPSTSVIGPEEKIIYPTMSSQVDYEAELGVVIRKMCKNVPKNAAK
jgi:2-keto-4-pentenoate hydratase/2-oxohepta-3-ene-1,7-dioic acid hydratase in catechol pathway